jgi:hypothetical protein
MMTGCSDQGHAAAVVAGAVSQDPPNFPYELYDLSQDWTQFENIAARYRAAATRIVAPRPSLASGHTEFTGPARSLARRTVMRRWRITHRRCATMLQHALPWIDEPWT